MAFLWTTLCTVVMVTAVMSKPICLSEPTKSAESSESSSSEEADPNAVASPTSLQPPLTESDMPTAIETGALDPKALLPSADLGSSPVTFNTSALPNPEDPQASTDTDALQLVPGDPSQTALGADIPENEADLDRVQDFNNTHVALPDTEASQHPGKPQTDIITGFDAKAQPQVTTTTTTTYQGFPQGATPPFRPHDIKPTPQPLPTTPPLLVPLVTSMTGGPGSFRTPEPDPPRGDSM